MIAPHLTSGRRSGEGARKCPSAWIVAGALALSACATPARMHDEAQLNNVALGCGLALGELIQDESEKKLLLTVRSRESTLDELTPQELHIAQLLAGGRTTRQAAAALFLSPKTIEYHLRSVYRKLDVNSRQALAKALQPR